MQRHHYVEKCRIMGVICRDFAELWVAFEALYGIIMEIWCKMCGIVVVSCRL